MASTDSAYKDEWAPNGSPFWPLYDDRIMFSGQPIALVVAEEPEIARFAASLVRVEYDEEAHVTDVFRRRHEAVALEHSTKPPESIFGPPKPRGSAG
jgi:xanthine dehydrogenase YagR molybdenum-binding subunit